MRIKVRRGPRPKFDQKRLGEIQAERGCSKVWAYKLLKEELEMTRVEGATERLRQSTSPTQVEERKRRAELIRQRRGQKEPQEGAVRKGDLWANPGDALYEPLTKVALEVYHDGRWIERTQP